MQFIEDYYDSLIDIYLKIHKQLLVIGGPESRLKCDIYLKEDEKLRLAHDDPKLSLLFDYCVNNPVDIGTKYNHVIFNHCNNLTVRVEKAPISGMDVLKCQSMTILTHRFNYINCEYCYSVRISRFRGANDSNLNVHGCDKVLYNNKTMDVTPFNKRYYSSI